MESKSVYITNIVKAILFAAIAGVLGYFVFDRNITTGIICAGLPAGWRVLSSIFGRWIVTGPIMLVIIIFKVGLSCFLGWIIFPIDLIINIVKLILACRKQPVQQTA